MEEVFFLIVKTRSHANKVFRVNDTTLQVSISTEPVKGKANKLIIQVLAEYFNCAPSCVILEKGHTSSHKKVKILS